MKESFLESLVQNLAKKYDVFIASSSFESRSTSVVESICSEITFISKFVIVENNNIEFIQQSIDVFTIKYGFEIINSNNLDQLKTVDSFLIMIAKVLNANPQASFLVDITTFTRQNLLILLRLFRNNLSLINNKVQFIYSLASDYAIGLPEQEKWLSEGVLSVHSVFGYAGSILPSKPYHLILLMGYEVERAASLIEAYEPSKVTIGFANEGSSLSQVHYKLNRERYEKLLNLYPFAEHFEFSCSEPSTIDLILNQVDKYPDFNVVVTPMNNKISTLYLAAASFINTKIQIAIAVPIEYNYFGYSSPSQKCLIIDISDKILK